MNEIRNINLANQDINFSIKREPNKTYTIRYNEIILLSNINEDCITTSELKDIAYNHYFKNKDNEKLEKEVKDFIHLYNYHKFVTEESKKPVEKTNFELYKERLENMNMNTSKAFRGIKKK